MANDLQLGGQIFRHCASCSQCRGKWKTTLKGACSEILDDTNVGYACASFGRSCGPPDFLHAVLKEDPS